MFTLFVMFNYCLLAVVTTALYAWFNPFGWKGDDRKGFPMLFGIGWPLTLFFLAILGVFMPLWLLAEKVTELEQKSK